MLDYLKFAAWFDALECWKRYRKRVAAIFGEYFWSVINASHKTHIYSLSLSLVRVGNLNTWRRSIDSIAYYEICAYVSCELRATIARQFCANERKFSLHRANKPAAGNKWSITALNRGRKVNELCRKGKIIFKPGGEIANWTRLIYLERVTHTDSMMWFFSFSARARARTGGRGDAKHAFIASLESHFNFNR